MSRFRQVQIGLDRNSRLAELAGLTQGVRYDQQLQQYVFDFREDKLGDIMTLKYRPKIFKKQFRSGRLSAGSMMAQTVHEAHLSGLTIFYAYKVNKDVGRQKIDAFLNFIKYQWIQQPKQYEALLNKAVIGFNSALGVERLDLIVTPRSFSSIPNDVARKMKQRSPNALLQQQVMVKRSLDDIKINVQKYLRSAKTDAQRKKRMSNIKSDWKRATKTGQFQLKKTAGMRRNLYSGFMKFKNDVQRQVFNRIYGGNVLIVDDVVTSGSTAKQILNQVRQFAPKNVYIFVLIKRR